MPKNSDFHVTPYIVAAFAVIAFVMSVTLAGTAYSVMTSPGFSRVNDMVTINTGEPGATVADESAGSPSHILTMLVMFGVVGALASVGGCAGAVLSSQVLLIIFFVAMALFATIFLVDGASTLQFEDMIEPVIIRQAGEFCNATLYPMYRTHVTREVGPPAVIGCTSPYSNFTHGSPGLTCGTECTARVDLINRMGGCDLLRRLCENHYFEDLGVGVCGTSTGVADGATQKWTSQVASVEECLRNCNADVQCTGYAYEASSQYCEVVSPRQPRVGTWTEFPGTAGTSLTSIPSNDHPTTHCHAKRGPQTIYDLSDDSDWIASVLFVTAICFVVAAIVACGDIFTIALNKKGKKGPVALFKKMCCPCCRDRGGGEESKRLTRDEPLSDYSDS